MGRKIIETADNRTQGCWVGSKYAVSVMCSPQLGNVCVKTHQLHPALDAFEVALEVENASAETSPRCSSFYTFFGSCPHPVAKIHLNNYRKPER